MLIGSPYEHDPWIHSDRVSAQRQAQLDFYSAVGVPEEFVPDCSGSDADPTRMLMQVGGSFHPRTIEELARAVGLGFGLALYLQDGFDLKALMPVLGGVRYLSVHGSNLRGFEVLGEAFGLERLSVWADPPEPIDLTRLPRLKEFHGRGTVNAVAAARAPHLQFLRLELAEWPEGLRVEGPVEKLWLDSEFAERKRIKSMPELSFPEALTDVEMRHSRTFDLAGIARFPNLERVWLVRCSSILNVDHLTHLRNLRDVWLNGFRRMTGWRLLESLSASRLRIDDNYVISTDFGKALSRQSPDWHIEPKRSGRAEAHLAAFDFDEDGFDPTSFAPFTVENRFDEDGQVYVELDRTKHPDFLAHLSAPEIGSMVLEDINVVDRKALDDDAARVDVEEGFVVQAAFMSPALAKRVLDRIAARWLSR